MRGETLIFVCSYGCVGGLVKNHLIKIPWLFCSLAPLLPYEFPQARYSTLSGALFRVVDPGAVWSDLDPGSLVGSGSGCTLVRSGSGVINWIRIQNTELGYLLGKKWSSIFLNQFWISGRFFRILVWLFSRYRIRFYYECLDLNKSLNNQNCVKKKYILRVK